MVTGRLMLAGGLALWVGACHASSPAPSLNQAVTACTGGQYVAASTDELSHARELFSEALQGRVDEAAWAAQGYRLQVVKDHERRFWLLCEAEGAQRARGAYVFAEEPGLWLLQVPHRYYDLNTDDLALALLRRGAARAAAFNVVPRQEADLAHLDATWFLAFAEAAARVLPETPQLQLHGYARKKCETPECAQAQAILSAGVTHWSPATRQRAMALRQAVPNARLYPDEVRELGGTKNSLGVRLAQLGFGGFIHLELERALRASGGTPGVVDALAACH